MCIMHSHTVSLPQKKKNNQIHTRFRISPFKASSRDAKQHFGNFELFGIIYSNVLTSLGFLHSALKDSG